ncbi:MAG: hypothetical protein AAFN08_00035 [Cyanobacteria bacterium J06559_3]
MNIPLVGCRQRWRSHVEGIKRRTAILVISRLTLAGLWQVFGSLRDQPTQNT